MLYKQHKSIGAKDIGEIESCRKRETEDSLDLFFYQSAFGTISLIKQFLFLCGHFFPFESSIILKFNYFFAQDSFLSYK